MMIKANLTFTRTEHGGRKEPIFPPKFACIFDLGGNLFDCRLLLTGEMLIYPGDAVEAEIQFLRPDIIGPKLKVGLIFSLREIRTIASGEILKLTV